MRKFLLLLAACLTSFVINTFCDEPPAQAQQTQYSTVVSPANVAALRAANWSGLPAIMLPGYYITGDGGGGLVKYTGSTSCTDDGGLFFKDLAGNCFKRPGLDGTLAQWGITKGSGYNATTNGASTLDASAIVSTAMTDGTTLANQYKYSTSGISIIYNGTVPNSVVLDCGTAITVQRPDGIFTGLPGTLYHKHGSVGVIVTVSNTDPNNSGRFSNCMQLPQMLLNPQLALGFSAPGYDSAGSPVTNTGCVYNYPFKTEADLECYRADVILAGDTATSCSGQSCTIENIFAGGFDSCFDMESANHLDASNLYTDCDVGLLMRKGGSGITNVQRFSSDIYMMRGAATTANPQWTTGQSATEYWKFTGASASPSTFNEDGRAVVRATFAANLTDTPKAQYTCTDLHNSMLDIHKNPISFPVWVIDVQNTDLNLNGWNGRWGSKVISFTGSGTTCTATIDLLGSDYAGPVTTGQWTSGASIIYIRGPQGGIPRNLHSGQIVTSASGNWTFTTAGAVHVVRAEPCQGLDPGDAFQSCVTIDHKFSATQGTDTSITFSNGTYADTGSCQFNIGPCAALQADFRAYAGNSPAGLDTATVPANYGSQMATSFMCDGTIGAAMRGMGTFVRSSSVVIKNCDHFQLSDFDSDSLGKLNDPLQIDNYVSGPGTNSAHFINVKSGKSGNNFMLDNFIVTLLDGTNGSATVQTTSSGMSAFNANLCRTPCSLLVASSAGFKTEGGTVHIVQGLLDEYDTYGEIPDGTHLLIIRRGVAAGNSPQTFASGAAALTDANITSSTAAVTVSGMTMNVTQNNLTNFTHLHGGVRGSNWSGLDGGAFISSNIGPSSVTGTQSVSSGWTYEGEPAMLAYGGAGNYSLFGAPTDIMDYRYQPTGTAQVLGGLNVLGTNPTGTITGSGFSKWPSPARLRVDSEIMDVSTTSDTLLAVNKRGVCGTAVASHTNGAQGDFYLSYRCNSSAPTVWSQLETGEVTSGLYLSGINPVDQISTLALSQPLASTIAGASILRFQGTTATTSTNPYAVLRDVVTVNAIGGNTTGIDHENIVLSLDGTANVTNFETSIRNLTLKSTYAGHVQAVIFDEANTFTNSSADAPGLVTGFKADMQLWDCGVNVIAAVTQQCRGFRAQAATHGDNGGNLINTGFYAEVGQGPQGAGLTKNVGVWCTGSGGAGAINWCIYNDSPENNSILGNVRIGSNVAPTHNLDLTGTAFLAGGAISLNVSSDFAVDINTGTSAGQTSIGNASSTLRVTAGTWTAPGLTAGSSAQTGYVCYGTSNQLFLESVPCASSTTAKSGRFGGAAGNNYAAATTYFFPINAMYSPNTSEANINVPEPLAGHYVTLYVYLSSAPTAGQSVAVTLRVAGADTALTCTVSNTNTTCNASGSIAVTVGQLSAVKVVTSAAAAAAKITFGLEFDNP